MAKLQTLKPRLSTMKTSRLAPLPTASVERKRGYAGVKDRNRIRDRDCGLCQECKRKGIGRTGTQVDHVTPLWKGGSDEDSNKELLCDDCHTEKTAREAAERAAGCW